MFKYSYRKTHICCHTNFIHSYFTSVISYCMSWSHIQEQKPTQMTCIKSYKQHKHNSTYQYIRISSNGYLVPCSMYTISMIIDHKPKHVNVKSTPFKFGASCIILHLTFNFCLASFFFSELQVQLGPLMLFKWQHTYRGVDLCKNVGGSKLHSLLVKWKL